MYSYDEVFQASLDYFNGDELAAKVAVDKYLLRDNEDNILEKTPEDMHWRLAKEFYRIEKAKFPAETEIESVEDLKENFNRPLSLSFIFSLLDRFKYIVPQGSVMAGVGDNYRYVSLSNCYVVRTWDSYGGICTTDQYIANISKRRGGLGFDISVLRPKGENVNNSARTTTGAVSFLHRFSSTGREVGQNNRRAALMITMSIHHPDIEEFISVKKDLTKVTGANLSVRLSDEFLTSVENGTEYELRWPVDSKTPKISKFVDARIIWKQIIEMAHSNAEPGILFWDNILKNSPADCYEKEGFKTESTNPSLRWNTKVLTNQGFFDIKTLAEKNISDIKVKTINDQWSSFTCKSSGIKQLWKITLLSGQEILCTAEHKWPVIQNIISEPITKVRTDQLNPVLHLFFPVDWSNSAILIKSVEKTDIFEEVYDLTVLDTTNTFVIEKDIVTGNCSELPLSFFDSCRLTCLNISTYVDNKFLSPSFDFDLLYYHAKIAQRFMDDIIDLELEKIDKIIYKINEDDEPLEIKQLELDLWYKIRKSCYDGRRTGLGITGLGDTIAYMNLIYGSDKSIELAERIYKIIKFAAYESSIDMAAFLGAFPVWNNNNELDCEFFHRFNQETIELSDKFINGSEIISKMSKVGRRNIALLTIAPTGSVSTQTQTTSGIEPVFMLKYTRRKKINYDDKVSKVDYIDKIGDKWQEFEVLHHGVEQWKIMMGEDDITKSPYFGACAEEIDWVKRVELQGKLSQHCDHSISSTLNLPENVSVEEVAKIYETAWKLGLKGITVYRKNCRTGVLVEKKEEKKKRPRSIPCDVHHISSQGKNFFVLIGLQDNKPFEIFAGKNNIIDPEIKSGEIIKMKRPKLYKFIDKSGDLEISPITMASSDIEEALTRMMSVAIQNGTPISLIITQLEKCQGTIHTFAKCIARILKKYVKDGTEAKEKCPECNNQLIFENSCKICKNCGYSACS